MQGRLFSSLFWKLSSIFVILLILVGAAYTYLILFQSRMYFAETNQRINAGLAEHIVKDIHPFINGQLNYQAMDKVFSGVMMVNPSVEVYLLDTSGIIVTYSAPQEKIKLSKVSLGPIRSFIEGEGTGATFGDNPRDPFSSKVFSAAPVIDAGKIKGYIYVILGGDEYDSAAASIARSHYLSLGLRSVLLSILVAAVIGLIAIRLMTRKLERMKRAVHAFSSGDTKRRIAITSHDELDELGRAFNEMAERIDANIEQLRRADDLRRELIANVSHDLRTPLASMQGYLETLVLKYEQMEKGERIQHLKTTLASTERLTRLVYELFELSKLEARQSEPKPERFSMAELMNDLAMKFSPVAISNGISLSMANVASSYMVRADIGMIERVIQNLIDNAIRFTPKGGTVELGARSEGNKVWSMVRDSGRGIASNDLPHIFDRYYQARSIDSESGAGLGLSIVRKIVELHDEKVTVQSDPVKGTTFEFSLPAG